MASSCPHYYFTSVLSPFPSAIFFSTLILNLSLVNMIINLLDLFILMMCYKYSFIITHNRIVFISRGIVLCVSQWVCHFADGSRQFYFSPGRFGRHSWWDIHHSSPQSHFSHVKWNSSQHDSCNSLHVLPLLFFLQFLSKMLTHLWTSAFKDFCRNIQHAVFNAECDWDNDI